ncbi:MAG: hypothetical protein KF901_13940 [Myxococcales bacterium]|nr:hypothetical protein [Myxococcales bacterium]
MGVLALGCGGDDDVRPDAGAEDAGQDGAALDAASSLVWPGELPPTATLGERRGRSIARTIVHVHSPLSHDACDGEGWVDGELADAPCLASFRASLCRLHVDAAMITDHSPHVNEVPFADALWIVGDDEPVVDAEGRTHASRMACEGSSHRTLLTVGSENRLMPIGLRRHPGETTTTVRELGELYDASSPEAIRAFREAGAAIWVAHTEQQSVDDLRRWGVDGLELYNLHADVDPRIRDQHLGLSDGSYLGRLLDFSMSRLNLAPDLAVLSFLSRHDVSLAKWDTLLAEGRRVSATGGCDAHENTFPTMLADGERADSYRRMMSWITNHLLVDEVGPEGVADALARGRLYVVHEVFGTPVGFDFVAEHEGVSAEMGEDVPLGATLRVARPTLPAGFPSDPAPTVEIVLLRAADGGGEEVARVSTGDLSYVADVPGAYRVEVRMVPEHTRPYLGTRADMLIREVVWVYSSPIFVDLPPPEDTEPGEEEPGVGEDDSLEPMSARRASPRWLARTRLAERAMGRASFDTWGAAR